MTKEGSKQNEGLGELYDRINGKWQANIAEVNLREAVE